MSANPLMTWGYYLGEPLLRLVLNLDAGPLDEAGLSEAQRQVLHDLHSGGVLGPTGDPRPPVALSEVDGDRPSVGWRLRQRCGGDVPEPCGDDELTRSLTRIARDAYPVLLSPADLTIHSGPGKSVPASDPLIGLSHSVTAHPANEEARRLIADEAREWGEVVVESALGSDRLSEAPAPEGVLRAAAERWRHRPGAGPVEFMRETADCWTDLRRLSREESIGVPALIGLRGLKLENDREYELAVGVLRRPTDYERFYSPFAQIGAEVESVLATTVEPRVCSPGASPPGDPGRAQRTLVRTGRTISLASAVARRATANPQSAVEVAWITEVTPFESSGAFKPGPPAESWVPSVDYGDEEVAALAAWVERLDSANLANVEIAVERLLRALFEFEGGEALIDAVIAWENLLGTQSETVYRVTAGLSVLCENQPDLRLDHQKELKRIYDKRSRMVHGDIAGADLALRNRAIQVGLDALARLVEHRPDLLDLAASSARTDRLLLGIGRSAAGQTDGEPPRSG